MKLVYKFLESLHVKTSEGSYLRSAVLHDPAAESDTRGFEVGSNLEKQILATVAAQFAFWNIRFAQMHGNNPVQIKENISGFITVIKKQDAATEISTDITFNNFTLTGLRSVRLSDKEDSATIVSTFEYSMPHAAEAAFSGTLKDSRSAEEGPEKIEKPYIFLTPEILQEMEDFPSPQAHQIVQIYKNLQKRSGFPALEAKPVV